MKWRTLSNVKCREEKIVIENELGRLAKALSGGRHGDVEDQAPGLVEAVWTQEILPLMRTPAPQIRTRSASRVMTRAQTRRHHAGRW